MEELKFLIQRCHWIVTKLYLHFTFEQDTFKREFVLHNQKERQNTKTDVEKDFYKFMNNATFRVDFRDNLNNSTVELIIDEVNEISYYNLFDKKISNLVNTDVLQKEIEQKFRQKLANVKDNDLFKASRITSIDNKKTDEVDALESFKKNKKKKKTKDINEKIDDVNNK